MRDLINLVEAYEAIPSLELLKWAEANKPQGVEMTLDVPEYGGEADPDTIDIQWFERKGSEKGIPTDYLRNFCLMADELSVEIRLGVQKNRRYQRLVHYYEEQFGFEATEDDGEFVDMKRYPEGSEGGFGGL